MLSDDITGTAKTGVSMTRSVIGGVIKGALIGAGIALLIGAAVVAAPSIGSGFAAIAAGKGLIAGGGLMLGGLWSGITAAACGVATLFMGGTAATAATAPAAMGTGAAIGAAVLGVASIIPGVKEMVARHRNNERERAIQASAREQTRSLEPLHVDVPSRPVIVHQTSPSVVVQDNPQPPVIVQDNPQPQPQVIVQDNPDFQPGRGMQMLQKGNAAQSALAKG